MFSDDVVILVNDWHLCTNALYMGACIGNVMMVFCAWILVESLNVSFLMWWWLDIPGVSSHVEEKKLLRGEKLSWIYNE